MTDMNLPMAKRLRFHGVPYGAPKRKSQRRTQRLTRFAYNRSLRRKYGLRNKALLADLFMVILDRRAKQAAKSLRLKWDMVAGPPTLPRRVQRKLDRIL